MLCLDCQHFMLEKCNKYDLKTDYEENCMYHNEDLNIKVNPELLGKWLEKRSPNDLKTKFVSKYAYKWWRKGTKIRAYIKKGKEHDWWMLIYKIDSKGQHSFIYGKINKKASQRLVALTQDKAIEWF